MLVILLEALAALALLVLIVWWTMFHGRQRGELPQERPDAAPGKAHEAPAQGAAPDPDAPPRR